MLSRTSSALGIFALALAAGCTAASTGGFEGPVDTPQSSPLCASTPPCEGAELDKNGHPTTCVQVVEADVVDEQGKPVANFHAQVCGKNVCLSARSDAQGHLQFVACRNMVSPSFDIPGKSKYVTYAVPIERAVTDIGPFTLVPLAAGGGPMKSPQGSNATYASGGAVLLVPAGAQVEVNELDNPEPEDQIFRASHLDPDAAPGLVESSPALELFYGLAPLGTQLSQPATLTLPNTNQWPAGAEVEFFVQTSAQWKPLGPGVVSGDGKTVTTTATITELGLIGARRRL